METVYNIHGREQKCEQSFGLKNENTDSVCVCVTLISTEPWCDE
jgi:hypothetical protein